MQCPSCAHLNAAGSKFCSQCASPMVPAPVAIAEASASSGRASKILAVSLLVAVGVLPMVCMFSSGIFGDGEVQGTIESSGQPHGDYSMQPTACFSGEHESFFGVWVVPELIQDGGREGFKGGLKLVRAHTGQWEVYVESPTECQSLQCVIRPLDASQCSVFDVEVRNTNTTVNDIRVRAGHAKLGCRFAEGGSLRADLVFEGCS